MLYIHTQKNIHKQKSGVTIIINKVSISTNTRPLSCPSKPLPLSGLPPLSNSYRASWEHRSLSHSWMNRGSGVHVCVCTSACMSCVWHQWAGHMQPAIRSRHSILLHIRGLELMKEASYRNKNLGLWQQLQMERKWMTVIVSKIAFLFWFRLQSRFFGVHQSRISFFTMPASCMGK